MTKDLHRDLPTHCHAVENISDAAIDPSRWDHRFVCSQNTNYVFGDPLPLAPEGPGTCDLTRLPTHFRKALAEPGDAEVNQ